MPIPLNSFEKRKKGRKDLARFGIKIGQMTPKHKANR
jgi:hypothetical protein